MWERVCESGWEGGDSCGGSRGGGMKGVCGSCGGSINRNGTLRLKNFEIYPSTLSLTRSQKQSILGVVFVCKIPKSFAAQHR
jgi:hypothetical protein